MPSLFDSSSVQDRDTYSDQERATSGRSTRIENKGTPRNSKTNTMRKTEKGGGGGQQKPETGQTEGELGAETDSERYVAQGRTSQSRNMVTWMHGATRTARAQPSQTPVAKSTVIEGASQRGARPYSEIRRVCIA